MPKREMLTCTYNQPLVQAMSFGPPIQSKKIDAVGGMEWICDRILDGQTQRAIAAEVGITPTNLMKYISSCPERTALAREARRTSAARYGEMALEAIEDIPDAAPAATVARQRELALHYRWEAKVRDPSKFGDKLDITATVTEKPDPALLDARLGAILGQVIRPELPAPVDDILAIEDVDYTEITHDQPATRINTEDDDAL